MKYSYILTALLLFACTKSKNEACPNNPQYQALTEGAKEWLPYTNDKGLVFENKDLIRDTIDILSLFNGDDEIWVGDKCPITRGQFIRVNFYDRKSKDTIRTQVGKQDELRIFTKYNHIVFYDRQTILIESGAYKKYDLSTSLDGKTFSQALTLECAPENNCPAAGITKVIFSKGKGLVAYQRNGVLWTLK